MPVMAQERLAPSGQDDVDEGYVPAWWEPMVMLGVADGSTRTVVEAVITDRFADTMRDNHEAYALHAGATWAP